MKRKSKNNLVILLNLLFIFGSGQNVYPEEYTLNSPDKRIRLKVTTNNSITYSVIFNNIIVLNPSVISLTLQNGMILGKAPKVKQVSRKVINEKIYPVVPQKNKEIDNNCTELKIEFTDNFNLIFRVYNDGIAYRYETMEKGEIKIMKEEVTFNFPEDYYVYFPEEESFFSHNERTYIYELISGISEEKFASLPSLIVSDKGLKIGITESDLQDYPGMWLKGTGSNSLLGVFPAVALEVEQKTDRDVPVVKRAEFIARTNGTREFPWRILIIAEKDADLIESEMVFKLAEPNRIKDYSWIKPGKVAWDWWNSNNVYGVDFEAGINTETYKYYIDFASKYGIEYIILDEGWYKTGNLLEINANIDIDELVVYAKERNVGIILWVIWKTLDDQLEEALTRFENWGIQGIKVDFMQRDDQWMVNYYHKIAREAAKRHLLVDFHGAYKPAGLRRTYPNVLTREGVKGLEWCKWSDEVDPEHDLTIPFIRMIAGPMDYTPGAMINAQKRNFKPIYTRPMSQGTRVHQMAMYVVYESPLQMLADNPSNYLKEKECLSFMAKVPVVWDKTIVLDAKVGDFVLIARKKGDDWYVGGMTDWQQRVLTLDLSFLDDGEYNAEIFSDGSNAHRYASDYKKLIKKVSAREKYEIKMAPGGGWVAHIKKN
jgi:alpha-glucosidase